VITAIDRKHTLVTVTRSAYTQTQVRNLTIIGPPLDFICRFTGRFCIAVHVEGCGSYTLTWITGAGGGDSIGMTPVQLPLISYNHVHFDFRKYSNIVDSDQCFAQIGSICTRLVSGGGVR
jgi:hypothetical protein